MKRRDFLHASLAAGASTLLLPSRAFAAPSNNETMNLALIGCGRRGLSDMKSMMGVGVKPHLNARIIAVCDVDSWRVEKAKENVTKFYKGKGESNVEVAGYNDFRELLARRELDGVIISTPEHWHGLIGIAAANAGKHIFLQKPLTYSIPEGKALVKAVRANNVTLQVGSQQRSTTYFYQVCTIIRNNWLGALKEIQVGVPVDKGRADPTPQPVPEDLDYEMWLGPRAYTPYVEDGVHAHRKFGRPGWLQREAFCLGMITGWGAHMFDIAQWGVGDDAASGPVEYAAKGDFPDRGIFDVHVGFDGEALYGNGVRMVSQANKPGVKFITENGWAECTRGGFSCSDRELLRRKPSDSEVSLYRSKNHSVDFLQAARDGKDPVCPVEVGHRSNTVCVLHHASMKLGGRTIIWDPVKEEIMGAPDASRLVDVLMR